MGRSRYKILDENYPYFITSSIVTKVPLLIEYSSIVMQGLQFLIQERNITIYSFVIMPDHIHFIAEGKDLGKHISSFKSFTARQIINTLEAENKIYELGVLEKAKLVHKIDRKYQVWTEGFHPKQIDTDQMMIQKIEYIHHNPVKAELVTDELACVHSSAQFYNGGACELPLTLFGDWGTPTQSIGAR